MKKKNKKSGKKSRLKTVSPETYAIIWDKWYNQCHFGHRSGMGGEIGAGVSDVIEVFEDGKTYYVLSLNYAAPYACLESFVDAKGVKALIFAEPKDMKKLFGEELSKTSPKHIAEKLAVEIG